MWIEFWRVLIPTRPPPPPLPPTSYFPPSLHYSKGVCCSIQLACTVWFYVPYVHFSFMHSAVFFWFSIIPRNPVIAVSQLHTLSPPKDADNKLRCRTALGASGYSRFTFLPQLWHAGCCCKLVLCEALLEPRCLKWPTGLQKPMGRFTQGR